MPEQRDLEKDDGSGSAEASVDNAAQQAAEQAAQPDRRASERQERSARRGPPPNPLYHPLFLPVLLIAFSLWFGYDGFLTSDPDMLKHQTFNRIMFGIMLPICIWMVPRGIKEFREAQAQAADKHSSSKPS